MLAPDGAAAPGGLRRLGHNAAMRMPDPDPERLAHSDALARRIAARIVRDGGWIPFDAWMAHALYEPGLGYYSGPARPFGAGGDFVTAPELSPLFARCVARQIGQWFGHCAPTVIEFGAGSGRLAADLLSALDAQGTPAEVYAIVELSADLRAAQHETIARHAPHRLPGVRWLDAPPTSIDGVVIANEVLDAMPVRLWEHEAGALHELGVACDRSGGFAWARRPADDALRDAVVRALRASAEGAEARYGEPIAADPFARLGDVCYRSEVGEQAQAWVATIARSLKRGALLLVDYGFPAHEYYHPQRDRGTLVAHRRHRVHDDPLRWPGLQDLTAHVDFSAVHRAADAAGLELLGYVTQARFLTNCGMLAMAAEVAAGGVRSAADARALGALQMLLSEAEMGELFKVIACGRGLPGDALGFARGDRSGAL